MRAILCTEVGAIEDLSLSEVDRPGLRPGCVRVEVEAAGLNFVDALFVQGKYQIKPATPFVPGSEVAGVVSEVADDVDGISVGDRVMASIGLGGFCEQVVIAATQATLIPPAISSAAAATLTQSFCTALYALDRRAHLTGGEVVLVLGGGGGVGHASIQVAVARGADVIATASTPEKAAHARRAGARLVLDPDPAALKDAVRAAAPGGVDVVIDPVGGEATEPALRTMREGGRLAIIGFSGGSIPAIPANLVLLRNRSIVGVDWGAWGMANPADQLALLGEVLELVKLGALDPPEPTAYPLDHASEALDDLLNRRVTGKAALVMGR